MGSRNSSSDKGIKVINGGVDKGVDTPYTKKAPAAPQSMGEQSYLVSEPPHSLDAEQGVLGALMLDNDALMHIVDKLDGGDFYYKYHEILFNTLKKLGDNGSPMDVITVSNVMDVEHIKPPDGTSVSYLASLVKETPGSSNIVSYADIVRAKSILRQLINLTSNIREKALLKLADAPTLLDEAERLIFTIAEQRKSGLSGFESISPLVEDALLKIEQISANDDNITGLRTGIDELDNITHGLQPSDLIILAARPSMGKTALALNIAEHAALNGSSAAVFSMEMPSEQLIFRLLSSVARVNQTNIRTGQLTEQHQESLKGAVEELKKGNLYIDDTPSLTPTELRARARRLVKEHGPMGVFVVDYLQLMRSPGQASRTEEIADISRSLKALAKELKTPILALSQLNREVEKRQNKRPQNSDLRESGAIEQDADIIAFIYRDEVYNEQSEQPGIAEIIISKHRNGSIGTVYTLFNGKETRFSNLPHEYAASFEEP